MKFILEGLLGLFILFLIFTYGDVLESIATVILWIIGICVVLFVVGSIIGLNLNDKARKVRQSEGTDKMGCGAFSRRVVESVNARLEDRYPGDNAKLTHVTRFTEGGFDHEVYAVDGFYMECLFDATDAAYTVHFRTPPKRVQGFYVNIHDDSRRPGKKENLLNKDSASVPELADSIFAALLPVYDAGEIESER